jgi:Ran GTPase-activating protein (RanGAP) involved in mRNA processing and transport
LSAAYLLLNLELVHDGSQLRQDLVCLLVELDLCGNKLGEVAERLGGIEDLFDTKLAFEATYILLKEGV